MDPLSILLWCLVIAVIAGMLYGAYIVIDKITERPEGPAPSRAVKFADGRDVDAMTVQQEIAESKRRVRQMRQEDRDNFEQQLYDEMVADGGIQHGPFYMPLMLKINYDQP